MPAFPVDEKSPGSIQIAIGIGIEISTSAGRSIFLIGWEGAVCFNFPISGSHEMSISIAIPISIPIQPKYRWKRSVKKRPVLLCGSAPPRETGVLRFHPSRNPVMERPARISRRDHLCSSANSAPGCSMEQAGAYRSWPMRSSETSLTPGRPSRSMIRGTPLFFLERALKKFTAAMVPVVVS